MQRQRNGQIRLRSIRPILNRWNKRPVGEIRINGDHGITIVTVITSVAMLPLIDMQQV